MHVITNLRYTVAILSKHFSRVDHIPYSDFVKSKPSNLQADLFWIDLPTEGRWSLAKRETFIKSLLMLTQRFPNQTLIIHQDSAHVTRWNDFIRKWNGHQQSTWCTCQVGMNCHYRYHIHFGTAKFKIDNCDSDLHRPGQAATTSSSCVFLDTWLSQRSTSDFQSTSSRDHEVSGEDGSRPLGNLHGPTPDSDQAVCNAATGASQKTRNANRKSPVTGSTSPTQRVKRDPHSVLELASAETGSLPFVGGVTAPESYPACPPKQANNGVFSARQTQRNNQRTLQRTFASNTNQIGNQTAYPTEGRERQKTRDKALKEAGNERVVVKKKKNVEDHHDDCGDDLSSIIPDINSLYIEESDDDEDDNMLDNVCQHFFWGVDLRDYEVSKVQSAYLSPEEFYFATSINKPQIDIAEICGGEARTSKLAVRRHLTTGKNIDLIAGCDLTKAKDRHFAKLYFETSDVLVVVMAPICGPFGPLGYLNASKNKVTHQASLAIAVPVARFCGEIALLQLDKGFSFICEQPEPSRLYEQQPWPRVLKNDRICREVYDRCRCGLKVSAPGLGQLFIKKPTSVTASDPELIKPFQDLRCNGRHRHLDTKEANSKLLSQAQVWTWDEANRFTFGIQLLKRAHTKAMRFKGVTTFSGPTASGVFDPSSVAKAQPCPSGYDAQSADKSAPPQEQCKCIGCNKKRWKFDYTHNRIIGECRFPYLNSFIPTCKACLEHKYDKSAHDFEPDGHTPSEGCMNREKSTRHGSTHVPKEIAGEPSRAVARARSGAIPREPARKSTLADASSDLRGAPSSGTELGRDIEDRLEAPDTPGASGSGSRDYEVPGVRTVEQSLMPKGSTLGRCRC